MNHEILKRVIYDQREVIKNAKIIDRGIVLEKDTNNVLTGCGRKPVFLFPLLTRHKKAWNRLIPGFIFQLAEE